MTRTLDRSTPSRLISDTVIHSTSEADYVGYLNNPCDMVDYIDLYIDCVTGEGPCDVMQAWYWSISGVGDQPGTQTASSNTSLAQISQNSSGDDLVTFTPGGQSSPVTLYFIPGSVNAPNCEACSYGAVPVTSITVTVPGVQVTNVDLPSDQVKVTLQGASGSSGTLIVKWNGPSGDPDIADQTEGPGTYVFNPSLSTANLAEGTYSGVTATWSGASGTYDTSFGVLGTYENTQYNTPTESACTAGSGSAYLVNGATCSYEAGSLLSEFITQSWENGSGITINPYYGYNTEQDAQYCGNHGYLPSDWQGRSFASVPAITPSCGSAYPLSDSTVAISTSESRTVLTCGDRVLIVGLGSGAGTVKEVTDTGGGLSTTQLDNYNTGAGCHPNAFPTLGNFQTIRINR